MRRCIIVDRRNGRCCCSLSFFVRNHTRLDKEKEKEKKREKEKERIHCAK
jgi:hypothetical protein